MYNYTYAHVMLLLGIVQEHTYRMYVSCRTHKPEIMSFTVSVCVGDQLLMWQLMRIKDFVCIS